MRILSKSDLKFSGDACKTLTRSQLIVERSKRLHLSRTAAGGASVEAGNDSKQATRATGITAPPGGMDRN